MDESDSHTKEGESSPSEFSSTSQTSLIERKDKVDKEMPQSLVGVMPVTANLKDDLEKVWSMDFSFKGKFAFGVKFPVAPNPGLHIAPLGLVGLPLSDRDAESIKCLASQAPFGHGERLVVDTNVRHTWEIEPENTITFKNPAWTAFMDSVVQKTCAELGVIQGSKSPRYELYKLLLYETGSHFLPHQDTEKAPGMFATIIVVLPSLYSGGQVCVSHGSENNTFDFSDDGFSTALLAWYADVTHEVKPITSGYRLALSYNLIHETTSSPLPSVPKSSLAAEKIRNIFKKWSSGSYDDDAPQFIASVLDHEYSSVDLSLGEKALKGTDAQRVGIIRSVAAEEGVAVALAKLKCHIVGSADDGYDEYYGGQPDMGEETDRTTTLSSLVDLDGRVLMSKGELCPTNEELIPEDPFEGKDPDDQDYEGYMGNYPGDVEYWYERVALVLYLEADSQGLLLEAGGSDYAISQLKLRNCDEPSPLDRKFASFVAEHLTSPGISITSNGRQQGYYIAMLAIRWNDSGLWLKIASGLGAERNLSMLDESILNAAWEAFGFDVLRPLFEKAIVMCPTLTAQSKLIGSIVVRAQNEGDRAKISKWSEEQVALALTHLKRPVLDDIPLFIGSLKDKGMQFFVDIIQPQLASQKCAFEFWSAFAKALQLEKESLSNTSSSSISFDQAVEFCLKSATACWCEAGNGNTSLNRIKEFIDFCLQIKRTDLCKPIFLSLVSLVSGYTDVGVRYKELFMPLVPHLRRVLNSHSIQLNSQPFGDFFRYLIETFLCCMLGAKAGKMRHNAIRRVGCGCQYCREVDTFMLSTDSHRVFRFKQKERIHVEQCLSRASDIVNFTVIRSGSPYGLSVSKHDDIVAAASWEGRQKATQSFLGSFGGDEALKLIMGSRYLDIRKAISGEKAYTNVATPYVSPPYSAEEPSQPQLRAMNIDLSRSTAPPPSIPTVAPDRPLISRSNTVTGMKRKREKPDVIELSD